MAKITKLRPQRGRPVKTPRDYAREYMAQRGIKKAIEIAEGKSAIAAMQAVEFLSKVADLDTMSEDSNVVYDVAFVELKPADVAGA